MEGEDRDGYRQPWGTVRPDANSETVDQEISLLPIHSCSMYTDICLYPSHNVQYVVVS